MKSFRNFLRRMDIFGVLFNFRYKTKDKYSTPCGGFLFLLFVVLALTFGIYYLIPFINRKNLSIIYYTMNIPETEVIKLKDSQAAFAIGLDCENKTAQDPYEIFNLEIKYVLYTKDMDGKYDKKINIFKFYKLKRMNIKHLLQLIYVHTMIFITIMTHLLII